MIVNRYEFVKSYEHFDLWKRTKGGYYECFAKGEQPPEIKVRNYTKAWEKRRKKRKVNKNSVIWNKTGKNQFDMY